MEFYNLSNNILSLEINDEIGFWGISQQSVKAQIDSNPNADINLNISSLGGDVNHAFAIYNMLKSHKGMVTANIYGDAASAATLIALGADKVNMASNVFFMIHNVWTMAVGDSGELRKTADLMDKINDQIVDAYKKKTGLRRSEIKQLMDNETWFTADEAKAKGFIDKINEPNNILNRVEATIKNSLKPELANELLNKININQKPNQMAEINEQSIVDKVVDAIKNLGKKEEVAKTEINVDEVVNNAVSTALEATTKQIEALQAKLAEKDAEINNKAKESEKIAEELAKVQASATKVESKEDTADVEEKEDALAYTKSIINLVKQVKQIN